MRKIKSFLKILVLLFVAVGLLACSGNDNQGAKKQDKEAGQTDIVSDQTQDKEEDLEDSKEIRVVSGTASVNGILEKLDFMPVGIPTSRYISPKFDGITEIGQPMKPDVEVVKSLEPDVFISAKSLEGENKERFDALNIKSAFLDFDSVKAIKSSILEIGSLTKKDQLAKDLVDDIESRIDHLKEQAENKESPKVLALFGSPSSIMLVTKNTYLGSILEELKIHNVCDDIMGDSEMAYAPVNMEDIVASDPDIILRMTHASPEDAKKMFDEAFTSNPTWLNMTAVKEGRVVDLENGLFAVTGNIMVADAAEKIYEIVYGE